MNDAGRENINYPQARILWMFGDWHSLADIEESSNHLDAELNNYIIAALFQLMKFDEAREKIQVDRISNTDLVKLLISGVYNNIAKFKFIVGDIETSNDLFRKSLELLFSNNMNSSMLQARTSEQLAQLNSHHRWLSRGNVGSLQKNSKLFIDCGGHDGCSVVQFLLSRPDYDVITFEANPELWGYYKNLPTTLIRKAVYDYDGEIEFIVDPIDADGSSLIKSKKIDFTDKVKNEDCPLIIVPCVDLSRFVREKSFEYQEIILKLDVEGAEYAILDKMLRDDTLKFVSKLYAEFHGHKIGISDDEHEKLYNKVTALVEIEYWDANAFSIHGKKQRFHESRKILEGVLV